jgi:2-polyprenyl-6-methoxyphenol hydroxylase-like FAD-dependent oxidoreductase
VRGVPGDAEDRRAVKVLVVGGGIGGLATALSLDAVGIDCEVFEQSRGIHELGVGFNTLPHAIKELADLGLLDALDRVAIRTHELIYMNRFGQEIWREPRGLDAGYDFPQFSIHRGRMQGVLYQAVKERIGEKNIHTAHQLRGFTQDDNGVTATFVRRNGSSEEVTVRADALIGADGIHSTVRREFYPDEGPPTWNGVMLWRGAVEYPPFLTGRSMIISGGNLSKLVLYPISNQTSTPEKNLLNWAVVAKISDGSTPPPRREDWNRVGRLDELLPHLEGVIRLSVLDPVEVVRATDEFYEYPMCDRDPVPRWSFGRVTLLGDAAHPMYPMGSNGASQAILDARCLAPLLAKTDDVAEALKAYEDTRLPTTSEIVRDNRAGGPERVIDLVEQRAPDGFTNLDDVATHDELEAIVKGYSKLAGFDQTQVNR